MMKWLGLFLILTLMLPVTGHTQTYRRLVNFEWEPIPNATAYELEITQLKKDDQKTYSFKVKDAAWNGRLPSGNYKMKVRALDYRSVPGVWSEPSDFLVELEKAKLLQPANANQISSKEDESDSVLFKWEPVGGATYYKFELISADGKTKKTEEIKETQISFKLPVAQKYQWSVMAFNDNKMKSEALSEANFALIGPKLETPQIIKPENEFVRELKWNRPNHTEKYNLAFMHYNKNEKKWEKVKELTDYSDENVPFDAKWPGGKWKLAIRGKAQDRGASDIASETFAVRNGNRSPAAEYVTEIRKSVDRVKGWYGIASYLITMVDFSSLVYESSSSVSFNAIGGTGRLGLGWFGENTPWGFLGVTDLSGFTTTQKTLTFASTELSAVYKINLGERNELRIQSGLFYKQLPVIYSSNAAGTTYDYGSVATMGPHVGAEYWWPMSPKFGMQVNSHLYFSLLKMQTPNGEAISPSMSTQVGFMGSYRYSQKLTGLVGYTYRMDDARYNVSSSSSFQSSSGTNETKLTGNYLNFFAEYAF